MNRIKTKTITLIAIIFALALYRLLPHPLNVTPVMAMALFSGAHFDKKVYAVLVPLLAMLLSDLIIGLHNTIFFVYFAMLISVLLGFWLRHSISSGRVLLASVAGSLLFFVITNFGVWLMNDFYSKDILGLAESYLMALPFLQRSLLGDLFFNGVLFFSYHYFLVNKSKALNAS
ncbi:MAG: hypothetical protein HWD86_02670 [Kangiellaceae bacterium]|nr:hypothetical protein [Kangiellaceae bacterium]